MAVRCVVFYWLYYSCLLSLNAFGIVPCRRSYHRRMHLFHDFPGIGLQNSVQSNDFFGNYTNFF